MARKKKVEEEQLVTTEVVETKKKSSKKKKVVVETPVIIQQEEPGLVIEEDEMFVSVEDDSPQEQDYTMEDMLSVLDESIESDDEECVSDEVLDNFDKALEEKGLGENYFRKKEERLKEMELEHELHEFEIDKMLSEEV
ncbi:hypothetical protein H8S53_01125 [Bacteroides sp. NSJ-21]|mgnify:FL=1|uniref:Uncharacterized protein n=1 Tax=Bacteroides parvus TaxID=2763025 RepID=A0ABR7BX00_9BACE|nr:hypothetical protein [Bacteroides parvus]MBC5589875.1 hypothetical protein [Bacteroides parvus]